jgi:2,4-dienoyl-CoA reductase-like NADH-dependent reductase (Old Yellow Enzyme family)
VAVDNGLPSQPRARSLSEQRSTRRDESFAFGNVTLNNRIVMAPMTRQFSPDGVPGSDVAAYYRRRTENSVGLIVTEGTLINHPDSSNLANVPHFYGEAE